MHASEDGESALSVEEARMTTEAWLFARRARLCLDKWSSLEAAVGTLSIRGKNAALGRLEGRRWAFVGGG